MKKILSYLFMILGFLTQSCEEKKATQFVNKYDKEDFSEFTNMGFLIRNYDNGNPIIMINTNYKNAYNQGPYIITFDPKEKKILQENKSLMGQDSLLLDKERITELTTKFLSYEVLRLAIDTSENVYVGLANIEKPDLIRFSNQNFKTKKYMEWKQVKDLWYSEN